MGENTESTRRPRYAGPFVNLLVLCAAIIVVAAVGEALFRYRFGPIGYRPAPAVLDIQQYLVTNPDYGFAWRPNIRAEENIVFDVADVEFEPLSTDADGFINHSDAINLDSADVIGLGDSFVEHAAQTWFEMFRQRGLTYRNLAMHRTAPPQYERVFESHAAALHPKWVIIGLFENDFAESADFYEWQSSGLDWFTYHSGTWCGPPADDSLIVKARDAVIPGWLAAIRNTRAHLRGDRMSVTGPTEQEIQSVIESLRAIIQSAKAIGARPLLVLIPSKPTATDALTKEAEAYDQIIAALDADTDVIDLRAPFREHADPASLYYKVDGHWNRAGMTFAGELIGDFIERNTRQP